jgi:hypothetical protein
MSDLKREVISTLISILICLLVLLAMVSCWHKEGVTIKDVCKNNPSVACMGINKQQRNKVWK